MTSTQERERASRGFLSPYAEIFRIPRAWRFSVAGIIGRMPMSMFGLGTVLLISAGTGRYAVAGSVSAVGSLGLAVSAPQMARLADSRGQRPVLIPLASLFALGVLGLVTSVLLKAPTWTLFVFGLIAGASMPSLGPMARARWSVLLAGTTRLHAAFSLESVADELCFVIGPALVTILATEVRPAAGIAVAAVLCLSGTLWFAAQRGTEPRPQAVPPPPPPPPPSPRPPPSASRAGPGRAAPRLHVPRRDVRVDRPVDGGVRVGLRPQAVRGARAGLLRGGQRDRWSLVRHADVARVGGAAVHPHAGGDRGRRVL